MCTWHRPCWCPSLCHPKCASFFPVAADWQKYPVLQEPQFSMLENCFGGEYIVLVNPLRNLSIPPQTPQFPSANDQSEGKKLLDGNLISVPRQDCVRRVPPFCSFFLVVVGLALNPEPGASSLLIPPYLLFSISSTQFAVVSQIFQAHP